MRAAVVGAGLAGLSAASELAAGGCEVEVFEARGRVGGRVFSRELGSDGAVIEMGAEFILPGNTVIRELAAQLGLALWDKGVSYGRREPFGGPPVTDEGLARALQLIERTLESEPERGNQSAAAFLQRLEIEAGPREYVLARAEISAASGADTVPAADLLGVAHVDEAPSPGIAGGNQQLALELVRRLQRPVRLGTAVRRIAWAGGGVEIATDDGRLATDLVVVAVPARVLSAIDFDPPIPEPQRSALGAVRYGHAAKLFVPLGGDPEPRAVISLPERFWSWTGNGADGSAQRVVSAFSGSPRALEGLAVGEGPARWLESLRAQRPELELREQEALLSTWSDDEWVRGAYSVSPGSELTDAMAAPAGPLAFAGEHTAGRFSGLMEGALRSGRRAARSLLEDQLSSGGSALGPSG